MKYSVMLNSNFINLQIQRPKKTKTQSNVETKTHSKKSSIVHVPLDSKYATEIPSSRLEAATGGVL